MNWEEHEKENILFSFHVLSGVCIMYALRKITLKDSQDVQSAGRNKNVRPPTTKCYQHKLSYCVDVPLKVITVQYILL